MPSSGQTYRDFVRAQSLSNPCLESLVGYLGRTSPTPRNDQYSIHHIQVRQDGLITAHTDLNGVKSLIDETSNPKSEKLLGSILVIEDICPATVELLGRRLGIDPIFFCDHINTAFPRTGSDPLPPHIVSFPSMIRNRGFVNIHSQRILDLGYIADSTTASYDVSVSGNYGRSARRLVPIANRQIALVRSCCSVLLKQFPGCPWLCIILIDPAPDVYHIRSNLLVSPRSPYLAQEQASLTRFEDFREIPPISSTLPPKHQQNAAISRRCFRETLLGYFESLPPCLDPHNPTILGLSYYPLRIIAAEWMQYTHLMSRYVKHYEFSLKDDLHLRLHREDIVDLQRWRRRSNQTLHKLMLTEQFIAHRRGAEPDQALWSDVLDDYRFLTTRVEKYRSSLELIVPLATAMAQIADTRKSMLEASSVKHLTLIALVFVPLAYVASVFSMSDGSLDVGHRGTVICFEGQGGKDGHVAERHP
ncbi:hypothetical protein PG990_011436 [Apiospora arundinis]